MSELSTLKLNRNTSTARKRSSTVRNDRRKSLQKEISIDVIPYICRNSQCRGPMHCGKNIFKDCISYSNLAGTLNAFKKESVTGKVGSWDATMVKNLFKDFSQNHGPSTLFSDD
jgi:hypothetical protein